MKNYPNNNEGFNEDIPSPKGEKTIVDIDFIFGAAEYPSGIKEYWDSVKDPLIQQVEYLLLLQSRLDTINGLMEQLNEFDGQTSTSTKQSEYLVQQRHELAIGEINMLDGIKERINNYKPWISYLYENSETNGSSSSQT